MFMQKLAERWKLYCFLLLLWAVALFVFLFPLIRAHHLDIIWEQLWNWRLEYGLDAYYDRDDVVLSLVGFPTDGYLEVWVYIINPSITLVEVEETIRKNFCDSPWLRIAETYMEFH